MYKRLSLAAFLLTFLTWNTAARAELHQWLWDDEVRRSGEVYQQLEKYTKEGLSAKQLIASMMQLIKTSRDITHVQQVTTFLANYTYYSETESLQSDYFLVHSDAFHAMLGFKGHDLDATRVSKQALSSLMYHEILAMDDALRCMDTTAWTHYKKVMIVPRIRILLPVYGYYLPEDFKKMIDNIIEFRSNHESRKDNYDICLMGEKPPKKGEPVFATPLEWHQRREVLERQIKKTWRTRYSKIMESLRKQQQLQQQQP